MREDRFYLAANGEEINPKNVTIIRDKSGKITGYVITAKMKLSPNEIRHVQCGDCDTDNHRCQGCGVPISHEYSCCIDCALL